ncbi:MAG: Gldg family protein [Proteobacteria bacterium]|nr:Gldg family protein [Pseudomonadota bacterium]
MTRSEFLKHAVVFLIILLAGLVILNLIFSQITTARWDLTKDSQFTLSPATEQLLDRLDSHITVKVFLSRDLPAPDNQLYQNLTDLLAEFESSAHGALSFEIIEPESKQDEETAKGFGLRKVAVSHRDTDQRSMRMVFKGLTVIYKNAAETIPELRSNDNFEYLIAKSIVNLTEPAQKKVGILTGFGGLAESPILRDSMADVYHEVFGKRIEVTTVKVTETCTLEPRTDELLILNIQEKLDDCARYALEQAAFSGTSLAILQSPTQGDYRQPDQPRINVETDINLLLQNTGIQLTHDLLLDRTHNLVGTQFTEDNQIPVSLPALPIITQIDKTHPITQNLSALVLPFSGTLQIDQDQIRANTADLQILAMSAPEAVTRPSGGDIAVDALQKPRPDEKNGPFPLIAAIQTRATSAFKDKIPAKADTTQWIDHADHVRMLIIPNGEFLFTNKIIGYSDTFAKFGIHLFVNATEWLVQDNALIQIRNRALPQLLKTPDAQTQKRIIWINVLGIPALVLLLMFCLSRLRRLRQIKIKKQFSSPENL